MTLAQLAAEFALGIGAALLGANLLVLIQERRRTDHGPTARSRPPSQRPSMPRVHRNIVLGALIVVVAAAALALHR